ncbi:MAG: hypothetical protein KDD47_11315, partial [Acidobacteria bacterium]|nr:hypothetical protein [Acidobacteriota bacterium]
MSLLSHPVPRRLQAVLRRTSLQRPEWWLCFAAAASALLASYALAAAWTGVEAGNAAGRTYGVLACLLLAAVMLLGVRRRRMASGPGRVQDWVQLHVYGGGLFLLAVLCHSAFRWPRSSLTGWLLGLSAWLTASGLLGVLARKWIP